MGEGERVPIMPFYVTDFLSSDSVLKMPGPARSLYAHLLLLEWNAGGKGLPEEEGELARMVGYPRLTFRKWFPFLKGNLVLIEGRYHNPRTRSEYKRALQKRDSAKRAGAARWRVHYGRGSER